MTLIAPVCPQRAWQSTNAVMSISQWAGGNPGGS